MALNEPVPPDINDKLDVDSPSDDEKEMQNDVMVQGMKRIGSEGYLLQVFDPSKIDFSSRPEDNSNDGYRVQQRQRKKFNATTMSSNEKMNKV
ncbi:unnamed protein product [Didymodactylos carnosus]|uniref:Uncharacterized protein n=1 Tax=Didymodactylos carnosus TaxID=1234261 RepID=A0A813ZBG0_9BILA|nr:unnamed protein product [Didymodactylos carnosus]CAF0897691.1 unnamed protein product [Didymodactylos carnosus]CAF3515111.1 unnamed protein product [Didymodactylos carnosus]CAF3680678.1 unnamed protein product [Didymodactylos carnosus]